MELWILMSILDTDGALDNSGTLEMDRVLVFIRALIIKGTLYINCTLSLIANLDAEESGSGLVFALSLTGPLAPRCLSSALLQVLELDDIIPHLEQECGHLLDVLLLCLHLTLEHFDLCVLVNDFVLVQLGQEAEDHLQVGMSSLKGLA